MGDWHDESWPAPGRTDRTGGGWARALALPLLTAALLAGATVAAFWSARPDAGEAVQVGVSTFLSGTALALNAVQFVTNRRANRDR